MLQFMRWPVSLAVTGGLVLALAEVGYPQAGNRISGKVSDEQGGVLPGATVVAWHLDTGFESTNITNTAGIYVFPSLQQGNYTVTISMAGFATYRREGLELLTGQSLTIDVTMNVAAVAETITVTAESPMITTQESKVGGVVENVQIENVPINTRDAQNLALLVPGARRANRFDPTKAVVPMISFGTTGDGREVLYTIDGGENTDDIVGGALQQVSMDSVQEFEVVTSRLRAEYSRAGGGAIRIITKSGTNEFKGSVFEFFRDKALNAQTQTEKDGGQEKGPFRRHQFGGNLGGPIVEDKAFFFFTYERINQDVSDVLFLPDSVKPLYSEEFLDSHGGLGTIEQPFRRNYLTAKGTFQFNSSNRLDVRYAYEDNSREGDQVGQGIGVNRTKDQAATQTNDFWSILARVTTIVGTSGFNEFVFQGNDFINVIQGVTQEQYQSVSTPTQFFPTLRVGTSRSTPQSTLQRKYQFRDNFSWTMATHTMKFGAEVMRTPTSGVFLESFFGHGAYFYAADGTPDDLGGANGPGMGQQSLEFTQFSRWDPANVPFTGYGFYGQDDWRISDSLTLNLGLRYDLEIGALSNVKYGATGQRLLDDPRSPYFGLGSPEDDKNNLAPRVGFVYDVGAEGQTVVRGGFGVFYGKVIGLASIFAGLDATGVRLAFIPEPDFGPANQPPLEELLARQSFDIGLDETLVPGYQFPRSNQFSIGVSHQITPVMAFDADFIYAKGVNKNKEIDINEMKIPFDNTSRLFFPDVQSPNRVQESIGETEYTGLQLSLRRKFRDNVQFTLNYTLSENRGNGGFGTSTGSVFAFLAECEECVGDERDIGPLAGDARHLVVGSGVFVLPADFQVSALVTLESARALDAFSSQDLNGNGGRNDFTAGPNGEPAGRGNMRGDNTYAIDLRLVKFFRFGEGRNVQIMFEFFNLFNRVNRGREFENTFESSNFGQWNGVLEPGLNQFQTQLGVRFSF